MEEMHPKSVTILKNKNHINAYIIMIGDSIIPSGDCDIAGSCKIDKKYYRKLMKRYNGILDKHLMVYFLKQEDCENAIKFLKETFGLFN